MDKQIENAVLGWWESLNLSSDELKNSQSMPAPATYKAELKRCTSLDAVIFTEGFRTLWMMLPDEEKHLADTQMLIKWAMIANLLAFVKVNGKESLATAAGTIAEADKPIVSQLRFAQLQRVKTPDEFVQRLRRILQLVDYEVNVLSLVKDITGWCQEFYQYKPRQAEKRISIQWAMDYYQTTALTISKK